MKGPDCIVTFPGIGFDNLTGELHLTHDKLQCLQDLVGGRKMNEKGVSVLFSVICHMQSQ